MIRLIPIVTLFFLFTFSNTYSNDVNIAVIDIGEAIGASKAAKILKSHVDKEFKPKAVEADLLKSEIMGLMDKQQTFSLNKNRTEFIKLTKEIDTKREKYDMLSEAIRDDSADRQQEFFEKIDSLIQKAIADVFNSGSYDIVYSRSDLLHFNPEFDITKKLTEKLDETINTSDLLFK